MRGRIRPWSLLFASLLLAGANLRIWQFGAAASQAVDELALSRNIVGLSWPGLAGHPLAFGQAAPRGFLLLVLRRRGVLAVILLVAAVALTLDLSRLGARSLLGDEAIFANLAREAAVHGHWYPLSVRGQIYNHKPPLGIWLPAASFALLGVDERADRLPTALAGVAVAILVAAFAGWLFDPWTGALAGLLLATCRPWLFDHGARDGVTDPLLTLLLAAALLLYLRFRTTGRRVWLLGAGAAAALSSLLKGALDPLLLLAVTLAWEAASWGLARRAAATGHVPTAGPPRRLAAALRYPLALAAMGLAPYAVWLADNLVRSPVFIAALQRETVTRVVQGIDPSHIQGPGFYVSALGLAFGVWWVGILPAAPALVRVWRQGGPRARAALLLPIWAAVVVGCLSLSVSKLPWYVDPALPAVAVLLAAGFGEVAHYLATRGDRKPGLTPYRALRLLLGLLLVTLLAVRGAAAWRTLAQEVHFNPMHHLALAALRHRETSVYFDVPRADLERVREWNYFYMNLFDSVARPLPPTLDTHRCNFVVSTRAPSLLARPDFAGAVPIVADRVSAAEPDLAIIDLCGGALARAASAAR